MTTTTHDATAVVIAEMLCENTGNHFLDSGGAYGRHHQRNRTAAGESPVDYFRSRPCGQLEIYVQKDGSPDICPTLDLFHFLTDRLDHNSDLQESFDRFAADSEDHHLGVCPTGS